VDLAGLVVDEFGYRPVPRPGVPPELRRLILDVRRSKLLYWPSAKRSGPDPRHEIIAICVHEIGAMHNFHHLRQLDCKAYDEKSKFAWIRCINRRARSRDIFRKFTPVGHPREHRTLSPTKRLRELIIRNKASACKRTVIRAEGYTVAYSARSAIRPWNDLVNLQAFRESAESAHVIVQLQGAGPVLIPDRARLPRAHMDCFFLRVFHSSNCTVKPVYLPGLRQPLRKSR
jgi:hypothetical protein